MAERLDSERIDAAIAGTGWVREGDALVLDREFSDFRAAWAWATLAAGAADHANHHPDILVHGWNRVRLVLSTHSAGGITSLDLDLVTKIDELDS